MKDSFNELENKVPDVIKARTQFFNGWRSFANEAQMNSFMSGDNLYPLFGAIFETLEKQPTEFKALIESGKAMEYLYSLNAGRTYDDWQGLGFAPYCGQVRELKENIADIVEIKEQLEPQLDRSQKWRAGAMASFVNLSTHMIESVRNSGNRAERMVFEELKAEELSILDAMENARFMVMVNAMEMVETGKWPEYSGEKNSLDEVFYVAFDAMLNRYPWSG